MQRIYEGLFQDWQRLLVGFGVEPSAIAETFNQMAIAYSSSGRYYHTLEHIQAVLETLDSLEAILHNRAAVRFAAWFHDVVYDSQAADNEERSAEYAEVMLQKLAIPGEVVSVAIALILATKHHQADPLDWDCWALLDADLAILGASPAHYQQYAEVIRQEYAWVPEADYRAGRRRVLENFLQRDRIYWTPQVFAKAELLARQNLKRELQTL